MAAASRQFTKDAREPPRRGIRVLPPIPIDEEKPPRRQIVVWSRHQLGRTGEDESDPRPVRLLRPNRCGSASSKRHGYCRDASVR
jgi:hypothetical protein